MGEPSPGDAMAKLSEDLGDLRLALNSVLDELRRLRGRVAAVEGGVDSIRSYVNALRESFKAEVEALKVYAMVVSRVESGVAVCRLRR